MYLIERLRKICKIKQKTNSSIEDEDVRLNRLESFLLKLAIPFIRVAHCPRGRYLKVKGDLILISSDIVHSLEKILPIDQGLIPVSFKRKLSYSGSYIEEFIEKPKVEMYFSWFKRYNHLFKDTELDSNLIKAFEDETKESAQDFVRINDFLSNKSTLEEDSEKSDEFSDTDEEFMDNNLVYEPCIEGQKVSKTDGSSMFINKYGEDPDIPSIANRLATIIVKYEVSQSISLKVVNDEDIDDEIISKEQFLKNLEESLLQVKDVESANENAIDEVRVNLQKEADEMSDNFDVLMNPSKLQSEILSKLAKKDAVQAMNKMRKICVEKEVQTFAR